MVSEHKKEIARALRALKGADILADLSKASRLPETGSIAGQAVASAVMTRLGLGLGAPINDVDVFVSFETARGREMAGACGDLRLSSLANHVTRAGVVGSDMGYGQMLRATIKEGYRIVGTEREGMLNEVLYQRVWADEGVSETLSVLAGFDMNCVQAGVDAASGELVWTPGFEEFAATSELKVANVNTPFHTAVRYFKKKKELGCFGDDELNMALCALPWARGVFSHTEDGRCQSSSIGGRYGAKVHEDYLAQAEQIGVWFKEVKAMESARIWTMEPVFKGREELLARLVQAANPATAQGMWKGETGAFMFANASGFCAPLTRPEGRGATDRLARLQALMAKSGASEETGELVVGVAKVKGRAFMGEGDLSARAAKALARVINEHPAMGNPLSGLTLPQQGAAAIALKAAEEKRGAKVYGWLESSMRGYDGSGVRAVEALLKDPAALSSFFDSHAMEGERKLAEPVSLPAMSALAVSVAKSLLKVSFQELLTPNALEAEGREMRHCVGGYARAVESGESRIFKIEGQAENDRSTLELGFSEGSFSKGVAQLRQIRSFANKEPGAAARLAAEMVARSYNKGRGDQLLAVAAPLIKALDEEAVDPAKLKSARALLRSALEEATARGGRFMELQKSLIESLAKHCSESPEKKSLPAIGNAKIKASAKR